MEKKHKYGRLNLGFRPSEEYDELEIFFSTIPERKKAQAIIELYMFCKKNKGIEEVRNRLLQGYMRWNEADEKARQYEENFFIYNKLYLKKRKSRKAPDKFVHSTKDAVQLISSGTGEREERIPPCGDASKKEEKEMVFCENNSHVKEITIEPSYQEDDDYLPDIEAMHEFF